MNNEEKKQFLIDAHSLFMKYHPYDENLTIEEIKKREDEFWNIYFLSFKELLPRRLYKYRKVNKHSISDLENNTAWFSYPKDFDDTVDSTIYNDAEKEKEYLDNKTDDIVKNLSKAFLSNYSREFGEEIEPEIIDEISKFAKDDGMIDEEQTMIFLKEKMPNFATEEYLNVLKDVCYNSYNGVNTKECGKLLSYYMGINDRIRNKTITFSLAEEDDNQAMWGLYADESRGFCIEYIIDETTLLGQKMISNLFPVFYGEKEFLSFFDILIRGLSSKNSINGVAYEDYLNMFISMHTKDLSYSYQKEWRITFDDNMGGNLQNFPFARSIILGERMNDENCSIMINIAKKLGLKVYKREFNQTKSKIIIKEMTIY